MYSADILIHSSHIHAIKFRFKMNMSECSPDDVNFVPIFY